MPLATSWFGNCSSSVSLIIDYLLALRFPYCLISWHYMQECDMTKENKYMRGQGLPEYALMLVFVAVVLLSALTNIGATLSDTFNSIMAMF